MTPGRSPVSGGSILGSTDGGNDEEETTVRRDSAPCLPDPGGLFQAEGHDSSDHFLRTGAPAVPAGAHSTDAARPEGAHSYFLQSVEQDADFAMAYFAMAETAPTEDGRAEAMQRAIGLADRVSLGERVMILAVTPPGAAG